MPSTHLVDSDPLLRLPSKDSGLDHCDRIDMMLDDKLFVSSMFFSLDTLRKLQISHVLCVADGAAFNGHPAANIPDIVLANFPGMFLEDMGCSDLQTLLRCHISFIDTALSSENGRCLVHCQLGINRSLVVVIAYLMVRHHMTFESAKQFVTSRRPEIFLAPGYEEQLRGLSGDWSVSLNRELNSSVIVISSNFSSPCERLCWRCPNRRRRR